MREEEMLESQALEFGLGWEKGKEKGTGLERLVPECRCFMSDDETAAHLEVMGAGCWVLGAG